MTPSAPGPRPEARPCLAMATLAVVGVVVGLAAPLRAAPPASPGPFVEWWDAVGTATATMTIARVVGVVLAAWLLVSSMLGGLIALGRTPYLVPTWVRLTPAPLRRTLLAGTASVSVLLPSAAGAVDEEERAEWVLIDLGTAARSEVAEAPVLADLGPVAIAVEVPEPEAATAGPPPSRVIEGLWTVAPGDHLWRIAEETLRDHGRDPTDADTDRYWRRLIEANLALVGDDPDLIHPGEIVRLPPV